MIRGILFGVFSCITLQLFAQCTGGLVSAFPYDEDFEAAPAWTVAGTNSDWTWGTPSGTYINTAGGGAKSWVVGGLTGSGYNLSEQAYLLSPCFDFSNLQNPWIQFKIFWECEYHYDGLVLQSTLDNGTTWTNVGAYGDAVNCLNQNWYTYANINWLTSISVKHGWSGRTLPTQGSCQGGNGSLDWVVASHCLEGLAGQPQVRFRFLFGAGTTCNSYDGVALDDIHIGEAPTLHPSIQYTCVNSNTVQCSLTTDGCPTQAVWDFGDGNPTQSTAIAGAVSHSFANPGDYSVSATLSGLCYAEVTTSIQLHILGATSVEENPTCAGSTDGSITLSVVPNNLSNLNFTWSAGSSNSNALTNLAAGVYNVTLSADSSCSISNSFTLVDPLPVQVNLSATSASCGIADGSVSAAVSNATGSVSYSWNNGAMNSAITNVAPGNYSVVVTDSLGCTANGAAVVAENPAPTLAPVVQSVLCHGDANGSISCSLGGNESNYTWSWIPNVSTSNLATGLVAGSYSVTAEIGVNCVTSVTVTVPEPAVIVVDAQALASSILEGQEASLFSTVTGGTPEYSFGWDPSGAVGTDLLFGINETTTFTLTVTDGNHCVASDTVTVHVISLTTVDSYLYIPNSFTPNDDGLNDAFIPVYTHMSSPMLVIYNRWGELIFQSSGGNEVWYGQVNDGGYYAEDGVYEYVFSAIDLYGGRIERRGHVVLLR